MKRASVAELKARLSEYLAAVKRGQEVIVTERGKPIARLSALPESAGLEARLNELVRSGLIRPPQKRLPRDFLKRPRASDPEGSVLKALLQEREESW